MDIDLVNAETKRAVEAGIRIFQIHRFAESDIEHVAKLLEWADFELGSKVIDLGCGVGEVAKLMKELRPDLEFTLVNVSDKQLEFAPDYMEKIKCSFLNLPTKDNEYDGAMFCFSIGHEDIEKALKEAYRVIKKNGVVFIYDMERVAGNNRVMKEVSYKVLPKIRMENLIFEAGFRLVENFCPKEVGNFGQDVLGSEYQRIFFGTKPAVWRIVK